MPFLKFHSLVFILLCLSACGSEPQEEIKTSENLDTLNYDDLGCNLSEPDYPPFCDTTIIQNPDLWPFEYKGELVNAVRWVDKKGENYLINSILNIVANDGVHSAYLFSYHYKLDPWNKTELIRLVQDKEEECEFDLELEFLGLPSITDLDKDGFAEVCIAYRQTCRSDVSECGLKVIMHDVNGKYALRGAQYIVDQSTPKPSNYIFDLTKIDTTAQRPEWLDYRGRYENASDFKEKDPAFLKLADSIWRATTFESFE